MESGLQQPVWSEAWLSGASKAAILGYMRSAAIELATQGITINAVMPGNVQTPGLDEAGEQQKREMMASIPMRHFESPSISLGRHSNATTRKFTEVFSINADP